jgi:hypothetical protein
MVLNPSPQKTAVKVNIKTSIELFQDHIPTFVWRDQKNKNQPVRKNDLRNQTIKVNQISC